MRLYTRELGFKDALCFFKKAIFIFSVFTIHGTYRFILIIRQIKKKKALFMKISFNNPNINKYITPAAFLGVCSYQIYEDFKHAPERKRKKVFVRDLTVLTGAMAGMVGTRKLLTSLSKKNNINKEAKKVVESAVEKVEESAGNTMGKLKNAGKKVGQTVKSGVITFNELAKDAAEEITVAFGGIVTALATNYLAEKTGLAKDIPYNDYKTRRSRLEKARHQNEYYKTFTDFYVKENPDTGMEAASRVFEAMGVNAANAMEGPLGSLAGLSVTQQKGTEGKLKLASYELIANTAVPVFVFSATTRVVKNFPTAAKAIIYPIAAFSGLIVGDAAGRWFERNVSQKVADKVSEIKLPKLKAEKLKKSPS